jgi:hypothetical protein
MFSASPRALLDSCGDTSASKSGSTNVTP